VVSEANGVAAWATIRAGGAESADIPRSDHERAEGFHLTITMAVTMIATAIAESETTPIAQRTIQLSQAVRGGCHGA